MFQDAISAYPEHHHMERKRKQLTKGESWVEDKYRSQELICLPFSKKYSLACSLAQEFSELINFTFFALQIRAYVTSW